MANPGMPTPENHPYWSTQLCFLTGALKLLVRDFIASLYDREAKTVIEFT